MTEQTDTTPDTAPKKRQPLIFAAAAAALALSAGLFYAFSGSEENWARADLPFVSAKVDRGDTLADFSRDHGGQPAIFLALANREDLRINYPLTCGPEGYDTWPRRGNYFCNGRLNLREASTLRPDQTLRVFPTNMPTFAPSIAGMPALVPTRQRAAVLIDGSRQRNLDHGAAIAYTLQQRGKLGGIWVYTNDRVFEFIDTGRSIRLGSQNPGVLGALRALAIQPIDRVVLVTGNMPEDLEAPASMPPVIGYCMQSASCEAGMEELSENTGGTYVR